MKGSNSAVLILIFTLSSCCLHAQMSKEERDKILNSPQATLFADYFFKNVGMKTYRIWQYLVTSDSDRNDSAYSITTIYPQGISLRYFQFGGGTTPLYFAITARDTKDSLLAIFSFEDEHYYRGNWNSFWWDWEDNSFRPREDSVKHMKWEAELKHLKNLELNFNRFAHTLGVDTDRVSFLNMVWLVFHDLMFMKQANEHELIWLVDKLKSTKSPPKEVRDTITELEYLAKECRRTPWIFQAKEGYWGYWKFDIVEEGGMFKLKPTFYGDAIVSYIYM